MVVIPTLCKACTRYQGASTCSSFPDDTIPDRIVASGGEHRFSLHGEPPFELDPAKETEFREWLAFRGLTD